jgi:hypothetical protein
MCKVLNEHHGELISVKNNGDTMCFKLFKDAILFATDPVDIETLGEIELIEVNGAPPGNQSTGCYGPSEVDAIAKDLWFREPFKS